MEGENHMNREIKYAQNPNRTRLAWAIVYGLLAVVVLIGIFKLASHIRTHTLPVGQIELSVPYSKYLVGEAVTFTIKNNYNSPVYISNQCPSEPLNVYRQESGKWVRIHDLASSKDCSIEDRQVKIPANGSVSGNFAPWRHLFDQPGKYRIVAYVEYYNALPYQDFEVITPPPPAIATTEQNNNDSNTPTRTSSTDSRSSSSSSNQSSATQQPSRKPVTYNVVVNSSGIYTPSSLSLLAGDTVNFVYSPCCGDEIITLFSPGTIGSIKLDHDVTASARTFPSVGTWTFKALDQSGNTGTITVR